MCGIAGFANLRKGLDQHTALRTLEKMCRVIRHRGPDDEGVFLTSNAALGMRRLAVIDIRGGHQPLFNETRTLAVVFNGEIYNYRELRERLQSNGHRFVTNSDTEVIVHAYEQYGIDCVTRLRGMFAFAVWDERSEELFIARDRVGEKPLYYALTEDGSLVFGSELKALLVHPQLDRSIDPIALDAYLTLGYVPDPYCIVQQVKKLPPGHTLVFANDRLTISPYWDFTYTPIETRDEREWIEELRWRLAEAVRVRLVADVPLGAFLSGGLDSTAVVALMAQLSSRPVKTFSIGFREDSYNELKYARLTAERFATDHHEFIVTPSICTIVEDLVWFLDEPFADASAIPTYIVSKMARDHVTVVLSGDGGDELFAGYTRYWIHERRSIFTRLPQALRRGLLRATALHLPHGAIGRNYLYNISLDWVDRYIDSVAVFTSLMKERLYSPELRDRLRTVNNSAESLLQKYATRLGSDPSVNTLLYVDSKTYLPGDIFAKVDRMTMAASLEARAPLVDHELIEFVGRIPPKLKINKGTLKYVFKRAVAEMIPREIIQRPKQGFGIPLEQWIKVELRDQMRDILMSSEARQRGYWSPGYVEILLREHERGRRDHSGRLWALFMLEKWHRQFVD